MAKKESEKSETKAIGLVPYLFKLFEKNFGEGAVIEDPILSASHIAGWYSTGSTPLDCSLGGLGLPFSRTVCITGTRNVGKTSLALHCAREVQRSGGVVIFFDFEATLDMEWACNVFGVNPDTFVMPDCRMIKTVEDLLDAIYSVVMNTIEKYNTQKLLILVDSWDAVATKDAKEKMRKRLNKKKVDSDEDEDKKKDKHEKPMEKPSLLSQFFRNGFPTLIGNQPIGLIFILQSRVQMPKPGQKLWTDPMSFSGGQAIEHYSSVILKLSSDGMITKTINDVKQTIGIRVKTFTEKSKVCAPHQRAFFNFYFDQGIDDLDTMIDVLYDKTDLVTKSKYGIKIEGVTEDKYVRMDNLRKTILEEPEIYQLIKANVQKLFSLRQ